MKEPERIGIYQILRPLGEGGASTVFLASPTVEHSVPSRTRKISPGEYVAIKLFKVKILEERGQQARIRREVEIGLGITHPNLVKYLEHGHDDELGLDFLVMEFIRGQNLDKWVNHFFPLPRYRTIDMFEQLVQGLRTLHDRGITHRDIKPANVMVDWRWNVKLTDFGVAKQMGTPSSGRGGKSYFSTRYAAPEVLSGEEATYLSDLYSLGAILYLLITSKEIFFHERDKHRLRRFILTAQPDWSLVYDELGVFTDLARDLLEKNPRDRLQSAEEVEARLEELKAETPPPLKRLIIGYIATALTNTNHTETQVVDQVVDDIVRACKEYEVYLYQPRLETHPKKHSDKLPEEVYRIDRQKVLDSDLLIAVVTWPSFGVGQEVEIAAARGIPTLLVKDVNLSLVSRMVTGSFSNIIGIVDYDTVQMDAGFKVSHSIAQSRDFIERWSGNFREERRLHVGQQIRKHRKDLSRQEFSEKSCISARMLQALELGEFDDVGLWFLEGLAGSVGISLVELLFGEKRSDQTTDRNLLQIAREFLSRGLPLEQFDGLETEFRSKLAAMDEERLLSRPRAKKLVTEALRRLG